MADPQPRPTQPPVPVRLAASAALIVVAAFGAAYGLLVAPLAALMAADSPQLLPFVAVARGGAAGLAVTALSFGVAGATVAAAVWLAVDERRGWWAALAVALLWLPTGCCPLSAVILAVLALTRAPGDGAG